LANVEVNSASNADVAILVTEPSPEVGPNINNTIGQTLLHQAIIHRESEEYQTDVEEAATATTKVGELTSSAS